MQLYANLTINDVKLPAALLSDYVEFFFDSVNPDDLCLRNSILSLKR